MRVTDKPERGAEMAAKTTAGLLCVFLLAMIGSAQPNAPLLFSALNSASYDRSAIAQGSLFVVFGQHIGPVQIAQSQRFSSPCSTGWNGDRGVGGLDNLELSNGLFAGRPGRRDSAVQYA